MSDLEPTRDENKTEIKKVFYDDLQKVGKDKPLGYLPLSTIQDLNHEDPAEVIRIAKEKGLYAEIFQKDEPDSRISNDGWLFVADLDSLRELLEKNADLVNEYGWSSDPIKFIKRITTNRGAAFPKTKLFDLIADAYGDFNNPGRTDIDEAMNDPVAEGDKNTENETLILKNLERNNHLVFSEEEWQATIEIKNIFTGSLVKDKPVLYLGARWDMAKPLAYTDATTFVFIDPDYAENDDRFTPLIDINSLSGDILSDTRENGKRTIVFNWKGKERTVILYAGRSEDITPDEIVNAGGCSVLMNFGYDAFSTSEMMKNNLSLISPGGYLLGSGTQNPPGFSEVYSLGLDNSSFHICLFQKDKVINQLLAKSD